MPDSLLGSAAVHGLAQRDSGGREQVLGAPRQTLCPFIAERQDAAQLCPFDERELVGAQLRLVLRERIGDLFFDPLAISTTCLAVTRYARAYLGPLPGTRASVYVITLST